MTLLKPNNEADNFNSVTHYFTILININKSFHQSNSNRSNK